MGIEVLQGRLFRPGDGEDGRYVTVVNETFAERAWPGGDPVGRRLRKGTGDEAVYMEVIGVVPDVTMMAVGERPLLQSFWPHASVPWARELYFTVRTDGAVASNPMELVPAARAVVREVDDRMPVADVATMSGRVREQLAGPRFRTVVVDAFAGLAVVLILLGVYGVTALLVARRTREIGLRMALGARRREVLANVLGDGAGLALRGAAIGLILAVPAARAVEGLLFGVEPLEPSLYAGATVAVVVVAVVGAWIPALRAGRVDPLDALRAE
jgi:putative ABC transport system permease protein